MKKLITFSFVFIIVVCYLGNVYAALNCKVSMQASKQSEVVPEEEIVVDVNVSDIQSDTGIITFSAILEYDKNSLDLVKMEGKNGWETPADGTSYNSSNGKIAITRSGLGKSAETIFTLTFKVKKESKQNLIVTLSNISLADMDGLAKIENATQEIKVSNGAQNTVTNPGTDTTNNQINTSTVKPSSSTVRLPKTGDNTTNFIILAIGVLIVIMTISAIKIRKLYK